LRKVLASALDISHRWPLSYRADDGEELTLAHEGLARDPPSQYEFC